MLKFRESPGFSCLPHLLCKWSLRALSGSRLCPCGKTQCACLVSALPRSSGLVDTLCLVKSDPSGVVPVASDEVGA